MQWMRDGPGGPHRLARIRALSRLARKLRGFHAKWDRGVTIADR